MSKLAYITAALLLLPAPALAQIVFNDGPPPPAAPAKAAKGKSGVDKVICRSEDTIGSRLQAHQVCMTSEQWRAYEQEYKNQVAELQARTNGPPSN